ncbi:MAG TPA: MIP/aquaporin family protein [Terriglobales bacterium]
MAEFLGTAFLVAAVVGSGIMGERLAGGNVAIALLANTIATGAALVALILTFSPISGAHLNPAVSLAMGLKKFLPWYEVLYYAAAQFAGGILGTLLAHTMFAQHWYALSQHQRSGFPQLVSEFVATFGLLCAIWGCVRINSALAVPVAVGCYITAAYWFTASTSFANPAVTLARSITDSFAGIRPLDVPGFIGTQVAGAVTATYLMSWLRSEEPIAPLSVSPVPSTASRPLE